MRAHVWNPPADTALTPLDRPTRLPGDDSAIMELFPLPSWPRKLLPQHFGVPVESTAQV